MADGRDIPAAVRAQGYTMTTQDVCEAYGVTPHTVYRWKGEGRISGVKLGKFNYFKPEEVEAALLSASPHGPARDAGRGTGAGQPD